MTAVQLVAATEATATITPQNAMAGSRRPRQFHRKDEQGSRYGYQCGGKTAALRRLQWRTEMRLEHYGKDRNEGEEGDARGIVDMAFGEFDQQGRQGQETDAYQYAPRRGRPRPVCSSDKG